MEDERKLALSMFDTFLKKNSTNKEIEQHLFEYSNNNTYHYIDKLKYLFQLINPESTLYQKTLIQEIKKKQITSHKLIYGQPWELCKKHWENIVEEQNKTDKIVMNKTPTFTTTQFTCSRCKNNECKTHSLQTRSADEPMTIFVTCIKCNNTWRMG